MPKFNPDLFRNTVETQGRRSGDNLVSGDDAIKQAMELYPKEAVYDPESGNSRRVSKANITLFDDNPNNHWHRISGEQWDEFVASIREYGVLTPLIVRRKENARLEILAGHNRKYGALEAGLRELPYVLMNVDDVEASVILGITNNQRKDITDREWGWAYRNTYDALKKSVGRPAGINSNSVGHNGPNVSSFQGRRRTADIVADMYGIGRETVKRKMRLTFLVDELYQTCIDKGYPQKVMIDLSYIPEHIQQYLCQSIDKGAPMISAQAAQKLREAAKEGKLTEEKVEQYIFENHTKPAITRTTKRYRVDESLFPSKILKDDREEYINKALNYVLENGIML